MMRRLPNNPQSSAMNEESAIQNGFETTYEFEERDEDEYYYYSHASPSQNIGGIELCADYDEELASETATLNFCTDDRDGSESAIEHLMPGEKSEKKATRFRHPIAEEFPQKRISTFAQRDSSHRREGLKERHRNWIDSPPIATNHHPKCRCGKCTLVEEVYYEYLDEAEIHESGPRLTENDNSRNREGLFSQTESRMSVGRSRREGSVGDPPIDYSSRSFHDAKAAITAAAQQNAAREARARQVPRTKEQTPILKNGSRSVEREHSLRFADDVATEEPQANMRRSASEPSPTAAGGSREPDNDSPSSSHSQQQSRGVRIRRVGDTTIVTQHSDPYSFYWQLDQARKREPSPPRRRHIPATAIIDEVPVEDDEDEALCDDQPTPVEKTVLSPDSNDSGVNMESYYAKPFSEPLPAGWERHKDPSGYSYYWHVDSGVIQRDPPPLRTPDAPSRVYSPPANAPTVSTAAPPPSSQPPPPPLFVEEHAYRQTTTKRRVENSQSADALNDNRSQKGGTPLHMRFTVRSLGGARILEEDLCNAECSSHTVNAVISQVSRRNDKGNGAVTDQGDQEIRRWANGEVIFLDLDNDVLTLRDTRTLYALNTTRFQNIRVWGVGKENPQDFAYVTRDPRTRHFFCHVFRCEDAPALEIANALHDLCARIIHERQHHTGDVHARPTTLNVGRGSARDNSTLKRVTRESLLLMPVDEPKRIIRCHFIGITQVPKATGIDTLNEAVDRLVHEVGTDRWLLADVSVAPSTILIHEATPTEPLGGTLNRARPPVAECRVRFLSFLGIGRDIKHCAFIMHNACADTFLCYVFRVEPNAALMAKTIEAACKLRYQKVLDAHLGRGHSTMTPPAGRPITTTTTYTS